MRRWIGGLALAAALALGACAGATPEPAAMGGSGPAPQAARGDYDREAQATVAAMTRKDYPAAITHGERAAQGAPTDVLRGQLLLMVGIAHLRLDNLPAARSVFDRSIAANPAAWGPYLMRGLARFHLNEIAGSVIDFRRAMALAPTEKDPLLWHAVANHRVGNANVARESAELLVRMHPNFALAWYIRAVVRQKAGDNAGAASDYRRALALALDPGLKEARDGLASLSDGPQRPPPPPVLPSRLLDI